MQDVLTTYNAQLTHEQGDKVPDKVYQTWHRYHLRHNGHIKVGPTSAAGGAVATPPIGGRVGASADAAAEAAGGSAAKITGSTGSNSHAAEGKFP